MIEKENPFDNCNNMAILCKKCYEKKEYIFVICKIDKEANKLEFQCSKCDILEEKDIIKIKLDENLKKLLNNCGCKEHQDNSKFCAWCEESKENLCSFCIAEKLQKKEKYLLYMEFLFKIMPKHIYENQIIKLESLFKNYKIYCQNHKTHISLINKIIFCAKLAFNSYFEEDIFNYQNIKNISLNLENLEIDIDLIEYNFYRIILSDILNEDESKIKQKIFKLPFESNYLKLIPLKNEFNDNKNNNDDYFKKKNLKKNKNFALYNIEKNILYIYDINGNVINTIDLFRLFINNNKTEIIQYESNILLLFCGSNFIFISFSNNFQKYETSKYNLIIKSQLNANKNFNNAINSKLKLIKFNEKKVFLLYSFSAFLINFNEYQKNQSIEINANFYDDYIFDMVQIYYKDDENIINKELLCVSPELIITNDINGFETILDSFKNIKFIIYGSDSKKKDSFVINYSKNLLPLAKVFFELNYNNSNNMILLFVNDSILQISLKTKEITTIYRIETIFLSTIINEYESKVIKMCNGPTNILSFHNYNEKKKILEETVLFKDNLKNKIYIYNWDENTLLLKENYETLNLINLAELTTINDDNNGEKIFIHKDNLIIFK